MVLVTRMAVVILQVIRGVRKENENLVPDVVKNIKETISLPCDFKVGHQHQHIISIDIVITIIPVPG